MAADGKKAKIITSLMGSVTKRDTVEDLRKLPNAV
jgi:hypothetical protein